MNKARRKMISDAIELIEQARSILEDVQCEEQEAYDNMPESLQYSERGEAMSEGLDNLDEQIGYLSDMTDILSEM